MKRTYLFALIVLAAFLALPHTSHGQVASSAYVNFEGAQTNPISISADGRWLYAVNTPDARLSIFDLSQPSAPRLVAEIPVGIEPVSVTPRTNNEVWVVNQVSDSISIVSLSRRLVVDTIFIKDEPAAVAFAGAYAFVTVSRHNLVRVYDAASRRLVKVVPTLGHNPRALATSADGSKVYAAFALSGNRTTIIGFPFAPPPPSPTNQALPSAPVSGRIVDVEDPDWAPLTRFIMPDMDVVEIDVASLAPSRYFSRIGTINLGIAVHPTTGELYVANTDARNLVRFEPNLRARFVVNRVTRVRSSGEPDHYDLNAGIADGPLPNPAAIASSLAQPTALTFDPTGNRLYVAAFGSDRIGVLDTNGTVLHRIDVATGGSAHSSRKRGPRGLAISPAGEWLYALNRISNTISTIETSTRRVAGEVPAGAFDPTPEVIRSGRGFLYDAKLSGNGSASCAACHIDADMDFLAWDLGNPAGNMETVVQNGSEIPMHPMKGPMTTQTLRGLEGNNPLHWRGDRADFNAFNGAFDSLMGGAKLPDADMAAFTAFINTIRFMPNPNQNLDRTMPTTFVGGKPSAGLNTFVNEEYRTSFTCNTCHKINPGPGTTNSIQFVEGQFQPFKVPHLRNIYQKIGVSRSWGSIAINGYGLLNDGSQPSAFELLSQQQFHLFAADPVRKLNLSAFLMCFDTGMAPAVGYTRTLTAATVPQKRLTPTSPFCMGRPRWATSI